jgi:glutathione S-transferase
MTPSHELLYFDMHGLGETIRILLHAAAIDFTDTRISSEDWPSIKPTTPLGFLPVLKINGTSYCQSQALARYAAKKSGYYPDDPIEALIVDEITDSTNELMWKMPRDNDEEVKKKKREEWQNGQLTLCANHIESRIQSSGGKSVVSTASVADIAVHWLVLCIRSGFLDYVDTAFFDRYPGIL